MELKEFRPHRHASYALDERQMPWLKRISRKNRAKLHDAIAREIAGAVEDYLRVATNNLQLKAKLNAPISEEDLKAVVGSMRDKIRRMQKFACEGRPSQFSKKNPYYRKGDEKAPFYSEAFLYVLLGKEDARSVLYPFEEIGRMLGLEDRE